jgi:hypothetical protein
VWEAGPFFSSATETMMGCILIDWFEICCLEDLIAWLEGCFGMGKIEGGAVCFYT